ncbi:conjugal transfer protein TraN [Providencia heimbachae]|uniref:conjugal transfer protein TraN n=1 Tax=Providencia heimbachae TaxID=333962 RepID=UPI00223F4BC7|nr:conjugal transfer protein TraN [Providencia heimbachae]
MKINILGLFFLATTTVVFANNEYKTGSEFASGLKNQGSEALKNTNPTNVIPNYTANPAESGYYGGVTSGAASGLENAGMKGMNETDAGKTTMDVMKNRPPDKLDLDAPFLKVGIDMREKAESESGQISVPCQDVNIDKTEITSHQCERTPAASLACTRTAKITWEDVDGWQDQDIIIPPSDFIYRRHGAPWSFSVKSPVTGVVQRAQINLDTLHVLLNQHVKFMNTTFQMQGSKNYPLNAKGIELKAGSEITSNQICFGNNGENCRQSMMDHVYSQFTSTKTAKFTLLMTVTVKTKVPTPKIEWVENCPFDKSEEVKVETQCTEKGGTKTVTVGGKTYDVYSECWQYTDYYAKQAADNGSCGEYMTNPACTIVKTTCTESVGSTCLREQATFSCQKGLSGTGQMCGVELICASGECDQIKNDKANSFQKAVSALAAVAAAGEDVAELNDINVHAFTGKRTTCRKAAAGFSNCCKSGGWGSDVGLAHCDSEEKALGKAKDRKLTIYVGSYCSNKVLGVCLQKKEAYCLFDSKLAKIVQEQGRGGQLRIGFGSAKNSDCRGITVDELQAINFDGLNFADFYSDLESGTDIPADQDLINRVKDQIANGLQGQGGQ